MLDLIFFPHLVEMQKVMLKTERTHTVQETKTGSGL